MKSLDGLIGFLLDEIALCGEEGKLHPFLPAYSRVHSQACLRDPRYHDLQSYPRLPDPSFLAYGKLRLAFSLALSVLPLPKKIRS